MHVLRILEQSPIVLHRKLFFWEAVWPAIEPKYRLNAEPWTIKLLCALSYQAINSCMQPKVPSPNCNDVYVWLAQADPEGTSQLNLKRELMATVPNPATLSSLFTSALLPHGVPYDQLSDRKDLGPVYRKFCITCRHHLQVDRCSTCFGDAGIE